MILPALLLCFPGPVVLAQEAPDPVSSARIRLGPLGLTPSGALVNLGIDGNVFNTVDAPQKDFTFTVIPQVNGWFRAGRSLTTVMANTAFIYYQKFARERSIDPTVDARFELKGNRLTPWVAGGFATTQQRVGYEIDLRTRRETHRVSVGVVARVTSKTHVALTSQRDNYLFDADDVFLGSSLRDTLNRKSGTIGVEYRQALTPLTTLVAGADVVHDRFVLSPGRDSNSFRLHAGFDLSPFALISGRVRLGYRKLEGVGSGLPLPGFAGLVGSVGTSAVIGGRTRVEFAGDRDVTYSFELIYPYYVITGGTVTVTPKLTNRWDLRGRIGSQWLAYRRIATAEDRVDHYTLAGAGVGFSLGRDTRIGWDLDRERRASPIQRRDFVGYRIGTSVTYGR